MVTSNRPNPTATVVPAATENSVSAPPVNDNVCAKEAEPDVQNKGDLESLLLQKNRSLTELHELHATFCSIRTLNVSKQSHWRSICPLSGPPARHLPMNQSPNSISR